MTIQATNRLSSRHDVAAIVSCVLKSQLVRNCRELQNACRQAASAAGASVAVDGLPAADGSTTLQDDGRTHAVVVDAWREPPSRLSPP